MGGIIENICIIPNPAIPPYDVRTLHIRGIWTTEANNPESSHHFNCPQLPLSVCRAVITCVGGEEARLQQELWQMQQQLDVREQQLVRQRDLQVTELRARLGEETTDVRDATT